MKRNATGPGAGRRRKKKKVQHTGAARKKPRGPRHAERTAPARPELDA